MPMLGVMLLIFWWELWSASGEDDFFSVARTMPLVAVAKGKIRSVLERGRGGRRLGGLTFDAESCDALVDGVQSIFYSWSAVMPG